MGARPAMPRNWARSVGSDVNAIGRGIANSLGATMREPAPRRLTKKAPEPGGGGGEVPEIIGGGDTIAPYYGRTKIPGFVWTGAGPIVAYPNPDEIEMWGSGAPEFAYLGGTVDDPVVEAIEPTDETLHGQLEGIALALAASTGSLEQFIRQHSERMDGIEQVTIAALQSDIGDLQTAINDLDGRINDLDTRVTALENP